MGDLDETRIKKMMKKLLVTIAKEKTGNGIWYTHGDLVVCSTDMIASALYRVRDKTTARERERCAKMAEKHGEAVSNEPIGKACSRNIAVAIRENTDG